MDIILFFQSTLRKSWQQKLAGVHMFAQERGWFVQVISRFNSPEEIRNALKEWHPIGCLVDCAMSHSAPPDKIFRDIPTVYLDQDPACSSLEHPCLLHDSAAEAKLAGAELLKLKCKSYAYIGTGAQVQVLRLYRNREEPTLGQRPPCTVPEGRASGGRLSCGSAADGAPGGDRQTAKAMRNPRDERRLRHQGLPCRDSGGALDSRRRRDSRNRQRRDVLRSRVAWADQRGTGLRACWLPPRADTGGGRNRKRGEKEVGEEKSRVLRAAAARAKRIDRRFVGNEPSRKTCAGIYPPKRLQPVNLP